MVGSNDTLIEGSGEPGILSEGSGEPDFPAFHGGPVTGPFLRPWMCWAGAAVIDQPRYLLGLEPLRYWYATTKNNLAP